MHGGFSASAHIAQRVVMEFLPLRCGHAGDLLREPPEATRGNPPGAPTILLAPPRMWERIYASICTELRKRPAPARKLF